MAQAQLPKALQDFITSIQWSYAKTMPTWPHEYIVRDRVDKDLFVQIVKFIRLQGYNGKFYQISIRYFDFDGMTYWTMGAPIEETQIINRCRKEDTYEIRLIENRLPER